MIMFKPTFNSKWLMERLVEKMEEDYEEPSLLACGIYTETPSDECLVMK